MTIGDAKKLYQTAMADYWPDHDWDAMRETMMKVVAAKTDRGGGDIIRCWDCWDRKMSATAGARKIRQVWAEMTTPRR